MSGQKIFFSEKGIGKFESHSSRDFPATCPRSTEKESANNNLCSWPDFCLLFCGTTCGFNFITSESSKDKSRNSDTLHSHENGVHPENSHERT